MLIKEEKQNEEKQNTAEPKFIDGDILVCGDDKRPFIFKGFLDEFHPEFPVAYCGIGVDSSFIVSPGDGWWTYEEVQPATEEQSLMLFEKMHDAGYEWDAEKKKLREIDEKSSFDEIILKWKPLSEIPTEHWEKNDAISSLYLVKCGTVNGVSVLGYSNYSYVTNTWLDCCHATEPGVWTVTEWTDVKI